MDWIDCDNCQESFSVAVDGLSEVRFCPLCGSEITLDEDFEDDDDQ